MQKVIGNMNEERSSQLPPDLEDEFWKEQGEIRQQSQTPRPKIYQWERAYLYAKSGTFVNLAWPETNAVMMKNFRTGISQYGIHYPPKSEF